MKAHDPAALLAALGALRRGQRQPTLQARVVCALLDRFGEAGGEIGNMADLARDLGVSRGALHRTLSVLWEKGWLSRQLIRKPVPSCVIRHKTVWHIALTLPAEMRPAP